jgi:23S rRNA (guanosine2251-2'-O)-methyltransferase
MAQWIYGKNTVREALLNRRVKKLGIVSTFSDATILALASEQHVPVERMSAQRIDELVRGSHQGIIAHIKPFSYTPLDEWMQLISSKPDPLVVILDEVQDPQNLGAIIRNAVGLFADAIIIKKHQQVEVTPTVMKIASGAIEHIAIMQVINLSHAMKQLKDKGFWIASTTLSDAIDYRTFDYRGPIAVIFGSEGEGVSPLVNQRADVRIRIPLSPKLESFNVASSVAIVLAEVYRQRFPLK